MSILKKNIVKHVRLQIGVRPYPSEDAYVAGAEMSTQRIQMMLGALAMVLVVCSTATVRAEAPADYYRTAEGLEGRSLRNALHDLTIDHIILPYSSARFDVHDAIDVLDELPGQSDQVELIYSDAVARKADWPAYNREHVWPVSLGAAHGTAPYTDIHHIFACDANVNSARGNRPFDECTGDCRSHVESPDAHFSDRTWEPPDHQKGDVARALFYMDIRYEGDLEGEPDLRLVEWGVTTGCNCIGRLSVLRRWHEMDPVDERERLRNERAFSIQHNRNPFIDNPDWVEDIYGVEDEEPILELTVFDPLRTSPWINEVHYENDGIDQDEGFEIAGPAGMRLTGWSVMLYNGLDGGLYAEVALDGRIDDEGNGYGAVWIPVPRLQNGGADGLALIDPNGVVVEFISYEGEVSAVDGPAVKRRSVDMGVSQESTLPMGITLQRNGLGSEAEHFTWGQGLASRGRLNLQQSLFRPIKLPSIITFVDQIYAF